MMRGLAYKIAIVAGGAGDIGSAIVRRLIDEQVTVVIADFDESRGRALAEEHSDANVSFEHLDAGKSSSWKRVVEATVAAHGRLDIMINTAFRAVPATIFSMSDEAWSENLRVTLDGAMYGIRESVAVMKSGSSIVTFSSVASLIAEPPTTAYGAAKAAVNALTRTVAVSCAPQGIRLNCVSPGFTASRQLNQWVGDGPEQIPSANLLGRIPAGTFATTDEMAGAAVFLVSSDAGYITGVNLVVDGGYTLI